MGNKKDPVLEYWKWLLTLPMPFQWPWDDFQTREQGRKQTHQLFPYIITIEKGADEFRSLEEWCWIQFGPKHGKCEKSSCWHNNEKIEYLESNILLGAVYDDYQPEPTGIHSHTGTWTTIWALKTSYEDGFCDFCFKREEDAVYFKLIFGFDI